MKNTLYQSLINRLQNKHIKLAGRFQKNIQEGQFQKQSRRKKVSAVERLKKVEKRLVELNSKSGKRISVNYKHWAIALAMGVVVTTASQAQRKTNEGFLNRLKTKVSADAKKGTSSGNRTEAQTLFFTDSFHLGAPYLLNLHVGDIDGDGDTDAIYTSYVESPIILTNEGGFSFTQSALTTANLEIIRGTVLADFDNDGDLDLFMQSGQYGYTPTTQVWINDGSGAFTSQAATFPGVIDEDVFSADFDGDGDADIAYGPDGNSIYVYLNNGLNFTAAPGSPLSGPYGISNDILALTDVDGDADIDIAYKSQDASFNNGLRVFTNDATGTFIDAGTHVIVNLSFDAAAADFDNDGDMDIAGSQSLYPNVEVTPLLNDGVGNFTPQAVVTIANAEGSDVLFGADLNGDNFDDIIISTQNDSTSVLQSDGAGGFALRAGFPGEVVPSDLDGDGDIDFFVNDGNGGVVENQGAFAFQRDANDVVTISSSYDIDLVDIDGDGDLDVVQASDFNSRVWLNDGTGANFTVSQELGGNSYQHEFGDLDGDSDLDMIQAVGGSYAGFDIWTNAGGVLTNQSNIGAVAFEANHLRLTDLDGDGDLDIVCLAEAGPTKYLKTFINQGGLSFTPLTDITLPAGSEAYRFDIGDIDGDGDIDVVAADGSYGISTATNDGAGDVTLITSFTPVGATYTISDIELADLDGDGDLDAFATNGAGAGSYSYVFINDGAGAFTDNGQNVLSDYAYRSTVGDLDNDGDIDLITGGYLTNPKLWTNDGAGNFAADSEINAIADEYSEPTLGDLDNDGDLDIVTAGVYTAHKVFLNDLIQATPLEADSTVLLNIYDTMGGANWDDATNWNSGDVDTWFGITVASDRVTEISLPNNNVQGTIPASINQLDALEVLDLSSNSIDQIESDLSGLSSIQSVDLSDNDLDFGDLEPLVSVPGIVYGTQQPNDLALDTLVAVSNPVSFQFNIDGLNNQYQWYRDSVLLADSTRNEIFIESLGRDNMGEYYCLVENTNVPGLTISSATKNALASATIDGKLLINQNDPATAGTMTLLRVRATGGYDTTDVVQVNSNGNYQFNDVVLFDYILAGFADTTVHEGALPTYFEQTVFWNDATTILLDDNLTVDIVSVFQTNPTDGEGTFSGILEEELGEEGGRVMARGRVKRAGVTLRRGARTNRPEGTGVLEYYVYTNEEGEFLIRGIKAGEYNIDIQYPGFPMDEESDLDITIGNEPKNRDVVVDAVVDEGVITVKQLIILGTETGVFDGITIYPNPSNEYLKFDGIEESRVVVRIFNMNGAEVKSTTLEGENKVLVSHLPIGQYLIQLTDGKGREITKQRFLIR